MTEFTFYLLSSCPGISWTQLSGLKGVNTPVKFGERTRYKQEIGEALALEKFYEKVQTLFDHKQSIMTQNVI